MNAHQTQWDYKPGNKPFYYVYKDVYSFPIYAKKSYMNEDFISNKN